MSRIRIGLVDHDRRVPELRESGTPDPSLGSSSVGRTVAISRDAYARGVGVMDFIRRRRLRHGMARGVSVYGRGTEDPERRAGDLAQCRRLRDLATTVGVDLDGSEQSLARLDRLIDQSHGNRAISSWLGNEAGTYLASVLVNTLPGAMWHVWPNGHPVVRLPSGERSTLC